MSPFPKGTNNGSPEWMAHMRSMKRPPMTVLPASKRCFRCEKTKPIDQFTAVKKCRDGHVNQCKECVNAHLRAKPRRAFRMDKYVAFREWLNREKDRPCTDCGNRFPPECMDFDHVRGVKKLEINTAAMGVAMARILDELAKCDLVCANCHRIRTLKRRGKGNARRSLG